MIKITKPIYIEDKIHRTYHHSTLCEEQLHNGMYECLLHSYIHGIIVCQVMNTTFLDVARVKNKHPHRGIIKMKKDDKIVVCKTKVCLQIIPSIHEAIRFKILSICCSSITHHHMIESPSSIDKMWEGSY